MLTRVAQDAERALQAVEKSAGLLGDAGVTDAAGRSRGCITARDPTGSCRLSTPRCATDARARRLALPANKLHAAATNSPAPLPTAVTVTHGQHQRRRAGRVANRRPAGRAAPVAAAGRRGLRPWSRPRAAGRAGRGVLALPAGQAARGSQLPKTASSSISTPPSSGRSRRSARRSGQTRHARPSSTNPGDPVDAMSSTSPLSLRTRSGSRMSLLAGVRYAASG
jgi:hypothetical protein